MFRRILPVLATLAALGIGACAEVPSEAWTPRTTPLVDPSIGLIPQPNDLATDPATGTLAIPLEGLSATEVEFVTGYMNTLDGFPVHAQLSCRFAGEALDPATLTEDALPVYDVTEVLDALLAGEPPPSTGARRMPAGSFGLSVVDLADAGNGAPGQQVTWQPRKALDAGRRYAVLVTDALKTVSGQPVTPGMVGNVLKSRSPLVDEQGLRTVLQISITDADAAQLEPARRLIDAALTAIEADQGPTRAQVATAWTFRTHTASAVQFDPANGIVPQPNDLVRGADGTLDLPLAGASPALTALYEWMNELDGFSVTSAAEVRLTRRAQIDSLVPAPSEDQTPTVVLADITDPLAPQVVEDVRINAGSTGLVQILPPGRLAHGHTYLAALSRGVVTGNAGEAYELLPSAVQAMVLLENPLAVEGRSELRLFLGDADAAQLEPLRQATQAALPLLEAQGIPRQQVASLFFFTTGSHGELIYDPTSGEIPLPNDLVKVGDALMVPTSADPAPAELDFVAWLNALDGWSHVQHGSVSFTVPVDPATVPGAFTFVRVSGAAGVPTQALRAEAVAGSRVVQILPNEPLEPGTIYAVVATHDLKAADGADLVEANLIRLLKSTEPLVDDQGNNQLSGVVAAGDAAQLEINRKLLAPLLDGLAMFGTPREDILAFWVFSTHTGAEALFDPTLALVPFPSDLVLAFGDDGRPVGVNLPIPSDASDVVKAFLTGVQGLDGFSTLGATRAPLTQALDPATLTPFPSSGTILQHLGDFADLTLGLADITPVVRDPDSTVALGQVRVIGPDEALFGVQGDDLVIAPAEGFPFEGNHTYMALLLAGADTPAAEGVTASPAFVLARGANRLVNDLGQSYVPGVDDASAQQLEVLRQAYAPMFDALGSDLIKVPRQDILLFWTFTVQSTLSTLQALQAALPAAPAPQGVAPLTGDLMKMKKDDILGQIPDWDLIDKANLLAVVPNGRFATRMLLGTPDLTDPAAPVLKPFAFGSGGAPTWNTAGDHPQAAVPFLLSLPAAAPPAGGWPLVIFQHGMARDRFDAFEVADRLAREGFAVLALDAVWHGARGVPGADPSALYMYPDPFVTRDHYRQTVLDLMVLVDMVRDGSLNTWLKSRDLLDPPVLAGVATPLSGEIHYVGMSLGAQVGAAFAALDPKVSSVVLNVPGAHLTRMLAESPHPGFSGVITALLEQAGVSAGTPEAAELLATLQWVLDPSDPLNYAPHLCAKPLQGHAPLPVLVQVAAEDEFLVPAVTDELVKALRQGACVDEVQVDTYQGACHAFLVGCPASANPSLAATERDRAIEDIVAFLLTHRAQ